MANKAINKKEILKELQSEETAQDRGVTSTDLLDYLRTSTKFSCFFVKLYFCFFRFFSKATTTLKNHYCPSWKFYLGGTCEEFIITFRSGAKWVCNLNGDIAIIERNNIKTETLIHELADNLDALQAIGFKGIDGVPFSGLVTLCDAGFRLRVDNFKIARYRERSNSNIETIYKPIEK